MDHLAVRDRTSFITEGHTTLAKDIPLARDGMVTRDSISLVCDFHASGTKSAVCSANGESEQFNMPMHVDAVHHHGHATSSAAWDEVAEKRVPDDSMATLSGEEPFQTPAQNASLKTSLDPEPAAFAADVGSRNGEDLALHESSKAAAIKVDSSNCERPFCKASKAAAGDHTAAVTNKLQQEAVDVREKALQDNVSEDEANAVDTLFSLAKQKSELESRGRSSSLAGSRSHSSDVSTDLSDKNHGAPHARGHTNEDGQHREGAATSQAISHRRTTVPSAKPRAARRSTAHTETPFDSEANLSTAHPPSTNAPKSSVSSKDSLQKFLQRDKASGALEGPANQAQAKAAAVPVSIGRRRSGTNVDYKRLDSGDILEDRSQPGRKRARDDSLDLTRARQGPSASLPHHSKDGASAFGAQGPRPQKRVMDDGRARAGRAAPGVQPVMQDVRGRGQGGLTHAALDAVDNCQSMTARVAQDLASRSAFASKSKATKPGGHGAVPPPSSCPPGLSQLFQAGLLPPRQAHPASLLAGLPPSALNQLTQDGMNNMLAALLLAQGQGFEQCIDAGALRHSPSKANVLGGFAGFGASGRDCASCHRDLPLPMFVDSLGAVGNTCLECRQIQLSRLKALEMDHDTHTKIMQLAAAALPLPGQLPNVSQPDAQALTSALLGTMPYWGNKLMLGGENAARGLAQPGQGFDAMANSSLLATLVQSMQAHKQQHMPLSSSDDGNDDNGHTQGTPRDHNAAAKDPNGRHRQPCAPAISRSAAAAMSKANSLNISEHLSPRPSPRIDAACTKTCASCQLSLPLTAFLQRAGRSADSCITCEAEAVKLLSQTQSLGQGLPILEAAAAAVAAAAPSVPSLMAQARRAPRPAATQSATAVSGDVSDGGESWDDDGPNDRNGSSDSGDEGPHAKRHPRPASWRAAGEGDAQNAAGNKRKRRLSKPGTERCRQPRPTQEGMKVCCLCNLEFPRENFKRKANGYHWSYCSTCLPIKFRAERRGLSMDQLRTDFWKKYGKRKAGASSADVDSLHASDDCGDDGHGPDGENKAATASHDSTECHANTNADTEGNTAAALPAPSPPTAPTQGATPTPQEREHPPACAADGPSGKAAGQDDEPVKAELASALCDAADENADAAQQAQRAQEAALWAERKALLFQDRNPPPAPAAESGTKRCLLCERDRPIEGFKQESYCRECRPLKSRASKRGITVPELRKAMQEGKMAGLQLFSPITRRNGAAAHARMPSLDGAADSGASKAVAQHLKRTCSSDERVLGLMAALSSGSSPAKRSRLDLSRSPSEADASLKREDVDGIVSKSAPASHARWMEALDRAPLANDAHASAQLAPGVALPGADSLPSLDAMVPHGDVRRSHRTRGAHPNFLLFSAEGPDGDDPVFPHVLGCNRSALALQGMSTVCGLCQKELPPEAFGTRAKGYRNTYCISCHRLRARARRRGISVNELRELIIQGGVNDPDMEGTGADGHRQPLDRCDDSEGGGWHDRRTEAP